MSILRTYNIQNPDSASVNVELSANGGVRVAGLSTFSSEIIVAAGSTSAPSISPSGDSNTGIFFPSADTVCIGEGGTEVIRVNSSGSVGIGTTNPAVALSISGTGGGSYLDIYNGGDIRLFPTGQHTGSAQNVSIYCDTSGEVIVGGNFKLGGSGVVKNTSGNTILNQTGSILQVVTTNKTDTFTTTATTMTDVTGLSASITPSSTSNKILVHYSVHMGNTGQHFQMSGDITRNGTPIALGDAAGSRQRCTFGTQTEGAIHGGTTCFAGSYLDSPSSTSALTYQIRVRSESPQTVWINRGNETDGDNVLTQRPMSMITLMEVAG